MPKQKKFKTVKKKQTQKEINRTELKTLKNQKKNNKKPEKFK